MKRSRARPEGTCGYRLRLIALSDGDDGIRVFDRQVAHATRDHGVMHEALAHVGLRGRTFRGDIATYVKPFDVFAKGSKLEIGSSGWIRTSNPPVNSRMLCR